MMTNLAGSLANIASGHGIAGFLTTMLLFALMPLFGTVTTGGVTFASFTPILKELYIAQRIEDLAFGENRFAKYLTKDENFSGKKMPIPIKYGLPQGRSRTFATGKANITTSKYTDFYLTVGEDFGFVEIDHFTMKLARNDLGAFLRAKEPEVDGMFKNMGRTMSIELYGNGSGARGRISMPGASTTVTLVTHKDIFKFEEGQILKLASDSPKAGVAGAGVRAGRMQIETIDYNAGTFTVDQNVTTAIAAAQDLDYIYIEGDYAECAAGVDGWFPSTAPTAGDDWFDVDRSVNSRLSGVIYDAATAGDSPAKGIVKLLNKIAVFAKSTSVGLPDAVWTGTDYWAALELELGPKTMYYDPEDEATANVGFSAIRINFEGGSIPVFPDMDCPETRIYATNKKSLKLWSAGSAPALFDEDGLTSLRSPTANALDIQAYSYWNLGCDAPIANGVGLVTAQDSLFG